MDRECKTPQVQAALQRVHLPADGRAARIFCARKGSKPTSFPAAAWRLCAHGWKKRYGISPEQVIGSAGKQKFREWAYDRESSIGRLDRGLDEAKNSRLEPSSSMKNDWKADFFVREEVRLREHHLDWTKGQYQYSFPKLRFRIKGAAKCELELTNLRAHFHADAPRAANSWPSRPRMI